MAARTSRTPTSSSTRPRNATRSSSSSAPARRSSTSRIPRRRQQLLRARAGARVVPGLEVLVAQGAAVVRALDGAGGSGRRHEGRRRLGRRDARAHDRGRVARAGTRRDRHRAARRASARSRRDRRSISARRREGYGRSPRQQLEEDEVDVLAGLRHGVTLGTPLALVIRNRDHANWAWGMSPWPPTGEREREGDVARHAPASGSRRPRRRSQVRARRRSQRARAGERAADRRARRRRRGGEGAARGDRRDRVAGRVVEIGGETTEAGWRAARPTPRAPTATRSAESSRCVAEGAPPGLGSYAEKADRLDARLAAALMGIQAVKGVEIGDGFALAAHARLGGARRDRAGSPPRDEPRGRDRRRASRTASPSSSGRR